MGDLNVTECWVGAQSLMEKYDNAINTCLKITISFSSEREIPFT